MKIYTNSTFNRDMTYNRNHRVQFMNVNTSFAFINEYDTHYGRFLALSSKYQNFNFGSID